MKCFYVFLMGTHNLRHSGTTEGYLYNNMYGFCARDYITESDMGYIQNTSLDLDILFLLFLYIRHNDNLKSSCANCPRSIGILSTRYTQQMPCAQQRIGLQDVYIYIQPDAQYDGAKIYYGW